MSDIDTVIEGVTVIDGVLDNDGVLDGDGVSDIVGVGVGVAQIPNSVILTSDTSPENAKGSGSEQAQSIYPVAPAATVMLCVPLPPVQSPS